jgi:acyl-activating enzyme 14
LISLVSQSFEEAAQALELVRPTAFVFDGGFSSWAHRLVDSNECSSIGLYLILGDTCSAGDAANCKIFFLAAVGT